jgi:hypothetical protein
LIICGLKCKKSFWKHSFYNISAIFIALFIFELFPLFTQYKESKIVYSGTYTDNPMVSDRKAFVGYGPNEDTSFNVTASRENGDTLIYKVIYSFNKGKRVVPNNNDSAKKNIFFLGCSYVFGDGLNDNQTLPFYFSEKTNHKYNVVNFAFSGYGTHQALKILEENILKNKSFQLSDSDCVIYSFIPSHFERAAGYADWDKYGPYYKIENNQLVYKGNFDDKRLFKQNFITYRLGIIWHNSFLYKSFFEPKTQLEDVLLVGEMIKKMNLLLKKKGIRFLVLNGQSSKDYKYEDVFIEILKTNHIEHYFVKSIIKDLEINLSNYVIKGDGHPNEIYNQKIASFLSEKL